MNNLKIEVKKEISSYNEFHLNEKVFDIKTRKICSIHSFNLSESWQQEIDTVKLNMGYYFVLRKLSEIEKINDSIPNIE